MAPVAPLVLRQAVVSRLKSPTDLAFADGLMFYTERAKGLYVRHTGQTAVAVFTPEDLDTGAAGGMLAVTIDPQFSRTRFVYVFMRASQAGRRSSRVVRLTMDESRTKVLERRDIVIIPAGDESKESAGNEAHVGGALRFGPDGFLYVGTGDGRVPLAPQSLAGKVLRIDRSGQAAPGNHAPAGHDTRVYAHGMRDPVALAFHANTEALLVAQRRGSQPDDIAQVTAGANGGWDPRCAAPSTGYCEPPVALAALPTAWRAGKAGEGLSAMERLRDPRWNDWRNGFAIAFDRAQRLDLVKLDADGRAIHITPLLQRLGVGFKAVAQGPDGLYVVTTGKPGGEEIWQLSIY